MTRAPLLALWLLIVLAAPAPSAWAASAGAGVVGANVPEQVVGDKCVRVAKSVAGKPYAQRRAKLVNAGCAPPIRRLASGISDSQALLIFVSVIGSLFALLVVAALAARRLRIEQDVAGHAPADEVTGGPSR